VARSGERTFFEAFGPGLLFAGAAVGVSHLVQSTRAGATHGLALLVVVVLACAFKYPAFSFGPRYAAATGRSLLEGYRRQGRLALALYAALTLATMFTVQAAVTIVTAGLFNAVSGAGILTSIVAAGLLALCAVMLAVGRYAWLDAIIKVVVSVLTVATLAATLLVLPRVPWGSFSLSPAAGEWDLATIAFVAALIGWMPSAIDISVWSSLWTLAKCRESGHRPSLREAMLDFDIGYLGTGLLALCFVFLGAGVMFRTGVEPAASAGAFAAQILDLYGETLGAWSRPVLGVAAFGVMFSTTLTVVDGFPRAIAGLVAVARGPEPQVVAGSHEHPGPAYWIALAVLGVGSVAIIHSFADRLRALVDLATTLSFLTAPALAWLNHRAVHGVEMPEDARPSRAMTAYSWLAIAFLAAFAVGYLFV
jgi:Mn2+/Fe2+ NRAMP family transporter